MISDKSDTFILEVIGNGVHAIKFDDHEKIDGPQNVHYPIMTNWYLNYDKFPLGTLVKDEFTKNACGIERYDLFEDGYQALDVDTLGGFMNYMKTGKFTNITDLEPTDMYYPFSDYGYGADQDIDMYKKDPEFKKQIDTTRAAMKQTWESKDRTKGIWITSHSTVYDLPTKTLQLCFEEQYGSGEGGKYLFCIEHEWKWSSSDPKCPANFVELVEKQHQRLKYQRPQESKDDSMVEWGWVNPVVDASSHHFYEIVLKYADIDSKEIAFWFQEMKNGDATGFTFQATATRID